MRNKRKVVGFALMLAYVFVAPWILLLDGAGRLSLLGFGTAAFIWITGFAALAKNRTFSDWVESGDARR